jgi:hypothetical protein
MTAKKKYQEWHVLSLGAGKQSTFMLIEALKGRFGIIPDAAVFCDLGTEPAYVYENLERLKDYCLKHFNFKIDVISKGALDTAILNYVSGLSSSDNAPPFYLSAGGILKRHCTSNFKIRPIRQYLTQHKKGRQVILWIGISLDEMERQKKSVIQYVKHFYPLIEKRILISEIMAYFEKSDFVTPGKSACYFCPFRSDKQWRIIKKNFPSEFQRAVDFDLKIRNFPLLTSKAYLHRQLKPLSEIDFSLSASLFPDLLEECEGLCGL